MASHPEEILDRARQGDPEAFQELVRPHLSSIRRFALSFAGNPSDADDLAQEALIKAYRAMASYRGGGALSTWLYTIARHSFLDARRSHLGRARQRETELPEESPDPGEQPEALVVEKNETERLLAAIRCLDPTFRVPLVLSDVEGMSYEEIAEIEKVPIGTVRSRISRARDKLRQGLTSGWAEAEAGQGSEGTGDDGASSYSVNRGTP